LTTNERLDGSELIVIAALRIARGENGSSEVRVEEETLVDECEAFAEHVSLGTCVCV
jgi:hypothetical protein